MESTVAMRWIANLPNNLEAKQFVITWQTIRVSIDRSVRKYKENRPFHGPAPGKCRLVEGNQKLCTNAVYLNFHKFSQSASPDIWRGNTIVGVWPTKTSLLFTSLFLWCKFKWEARLVGGGKEEDYTNRTMKLTYPIRRQLILYAETPDHEPFK